MIAVPRRAQRDERLVRLVRGGRVDVERRAVALAKVAPDREATDHRPRACGVSDLVKRLDEPAIHRRQYELLHCQATSAPGTAGSIERQSPRISRPLAEVDRSRAATTGWTTPSPAHGPGGSATSGSASTNRRFIDGSTSSVTARPPPPRGRLDRSSASHRGSRVPWRRSTDPAQPPPDGRHRLSPRR